MELDLQTYFWLTNNQVLQENEAPDVNLQKNRVVLSEAQARGFVSGLTVANMLKKIQIQNVRQRLTAGREKLGKSGRHENWQFSGHALFQLEIPEQFPQGLPAPEPRTTTSEWTTRRKWPLLNHSIMAIFQHSAKLLIRWDLKARSFLTEAARVTIKGLFTRRNRSTRDSVPFGQILLLNLEAWITYQKLQTMVNLSLT